MRDEMITVVKNIMYEYGPEAFLPDTDCAEDIVDTILRMLREMLLEGRFKNN